MNRRSVRPALVAAVAALLALDAGAAPSLAAQVPTGRVVGRIIDVGTGQGLSDVGVQVVGTTLGAMSGVDGRFTVANVPAGTVSLHVRRLGYQAKTVTGLVLSASGTVEQNIGLEAATVQLQALEVTAASERGTVNEALDTQRNATGIVNAIGSEQIARSPDSDAAQAVQRVSGVSVQEGKYVFVRGLGERYTTTSLNGARIPSPEPERKVVPLDLFPSGLLQTITTSKTFTPDLSGDFSGAQVDIRTREFPARRQFSYSTTVGYNTAATGKTLPYSPSAGGEWLALVGDRRDLPGAVQRFGNFRASEPSQFQTNQMINSFRDVWAAREQAGRPNSSFSASVGGNDPVLGQRLGYLLSASYAYTQETQSDAIRALADRGSRPGETVEIDRFEGDVGRASVLWGGLLNLSTLLGARTRLAFNNTYNRTSDHEARTEVGTFEEVPDTFRIDRLRYVERSIHSTQLIGEHELGSRNRIDWSATLSGVTRVEPDRSEIVYQFTPDPMTGGTIPRWVNTSNQGAVRTFGDLSENSFEGQANYRLSLGDVGRQQVVKLGALFRSTDRDADTRSYSINSPGLADDIRALPPEQLFDGRLTTPTSAVLRLDPLFQGGAYSARDHLIAGFGMTELALGDRLRAIAGARVEDSRVRVDAAPTLGSTSTIRKHYTDVLPSAALIYKLSESQNVRLSGSQTLARPEYREQVDILSRDVLRGDNIRGNPNLRRTLIQNADLRWEWYPNVGELVSVSLFGKHFDQPIERVYRAVSGSRVIQYVNADAAENYGVEVELRKGLGFLSPRLSPLTAFTNATVMHSDITVGNSEASVTNDKRAMVGQAPYVVNAGLTYTTESGRSSATLLFNRVGERIVDAGEAPLPDTKEQPRNVVDLSLRFPLVGAVSGRFDARNLADAPFKIQQGTVTREGYRTGRIFQAGLSWRP